VRELLAAVPLILAMLLIVMSTSSLLAQAQTILVTPAEVKLEGNFARVQLVVTAADASGMVNERSEDLTGGAKFVSSDAKIVSVNERGQLLAVADGQAKITVTAGPLTKEVPVTVSGVLPQPAVGFTEHIRPILNKAGCAMAACHASQHGKGGFKLSVFGSEPSQDWTAMARDSVQRRTDFVLPENSLILLKPTMQTPHGGGKRIEKGSVEYQTMLAWVKAHTPRPAPTDPEVTKLYVYPSRRVGQAGLKQQIRVEAE